MADDPRARVPVYVRTSLLAARTPAAARSRQFPTLKHAGRYIGRRGRSLGAAVPPVPGATHRIQGDITCPLDSALVWARSERCLAARRPSRTLVNGLTLAWRAAMVGGIAL